MCVCVCVCAYMCKRKYIASNILHIYAEKVVKQFTEK